MKKSAKLIVLIIALAITTGSYGKEIGIKGGLNLSDMLVKDDDENYSDDFIMKPGFHLGITAEFPVTELFSFETGYCFRPGE